MRILILGKTGMLGSQLMTTLSQESHEVVGTDRSNFTVDNFLHERELCFQPESFDYVVNCIGAIKPRFSTPEGVIEGYRINASFPWALARYCYDRTKLIHITTDCVYSGKDGEYREDSPHDPLDDYGRSKSNGEPHSLSMVIRTSIIGSEIQNNYSLVEWAKSQKGNEISGYTNHYWNGLTTQQLGYCLLDIISQNLWEPKLFHVHSDDVSKDQLLAMISNRFNLGLKLNKVPGPSFCDRTLRSHEHLCDHLNIPKLEKQIREMT